MTLSTTTYRVQYNGNGAATVFAVPFKFLDNTHLQVVLTAADGTESVKSLTTHYTVSGAGDAGGGAVTMLTAPASGESLTVVRSVPITQATDLVNNDPFDAETVEESFDKAAMIDQQQQEQIDRSLKLPVSAAGVSAELPAPEAARLIGWNGAATGLQNYDPTAGAVTSASNVAIADAGGYFAGATVEAALQEAAAFTPAGAAAARSVASKLRDFVSVLDFPGADLGARLQAAYDARLAQVQAGQGLGAGIFILIPPNPDGNHWVLTTPVDLSSGGFVHLLGMGTPYIELGANLTYMIRLGVTNKSNRVVVENITFKPGNFTAASAILIGGGTQIQMRGISFQKGGADSGSFENGILIDRSLDPTGAGVSFSSFFDIHDTGGTACTNAIIKAKGLISSLIQNVRCGPAATYGVHLDSVAGDVQGNVIDGIGGEPGSGTSTALVRLDANTNPITLNTIRGLCGNNVASYGISCSGAGSISSNLFDVNPSGYATGVIDTGGVFARRLNLLNDEVSFTPTWAGATANPALGNGTLAAKLVRSGKQCTVTYKLVAGTTTTFGTGQYTFSLPHTAAASFDWIGSARAVDASAGSPYIVGTAVIPSGNTAIVTASFPANFWSPSVPMTWAQDDQMAITITYNVA